MGKGIKPSKSSTKSKSRSISVSVPSRSESTSSQRPQPKPCGSGKPCAENTCRKLHCDAKVDVALDVCPKVRIDEVRHDDAFFDVEVEVDHKPTCCIRHIKTVPIDKCHSKCVFRVDLGSKYTARAKPINHPRFGGATFNLDIDAKTRQTTTVRPKC